MPYDLWQAMTPSKETIPTFISSLVFYSSRYCVLVGAVFALAAAKVGRPSSSNKLPVSSKQIQREIGTSALTIFIFAVVNAILIGYGVGKYTLVYDHIETHGWLWFWFSIPALFVLHDTIFYWTHRLFHTRFLYRHTHLEHHLSVHATALASYRFSPAEAMTEALQVWAIAFMIPVHPWAFLIFQTVATVHIAYAHCGREIPGASWRSHWLLRWINSSTAHSTHHNSPRYNYGLYFLFWDEIAGTINSESKRTEQYFDSPSRDIERPDFVVAD